MFASEISSASHFLHRWITETDTTWKTCIVSSWNWWNSYVVHTRVKTAGLSQVVHNVRYWSERLAAVFCYVLPQPSSTILISCCSKNISGKMRKTLTVDGIKLTSLIDPLIKIVWAVGDLVDFYVCMGLQMSVWNWNLLVRPLSFFSVGEWQKLVKESSVFVFYGTQKFINYVPPSLFVSFALQGKNGYTYVYHICIQMKLTVFFSVVCCDFHCESYLDFLP